MGRAFEVRKASMEKTSAAKTKLYSRYGKEIYVVAKDNPSLESNSKLKSVVQRAKREQVPAHVIEKAIDKAKGGKGEDFSFHRYEGYGPGGCMVMIDCLTDNINRTVSEVRNCFTKCESKMGNNGSVIHMYTHNSLIVTSKLDEDEVLEALLENNIDVIDVELDGDSIEIKANPNDLDNVVNVLNKTYDELEIKMADVVYIPNTYVKLKTDDEKKMFEKFSNMLDECMDVQKVHHNVEE